MTGDGVAATLPLRRWQGERSTYHLVTFTGTQAEAIAMHARLLKLELGTRRGFGSVKVTARIGEGEWKTSVFPQDRSREWILLVGRKILRAEDLAEGDPVAIELDFL